MNLSSHRAVDGIIMDTSHCYLPFSIKAEFEQSKNIVVSVSEISVNIYCLEVKELLAFRLGGRRRGLGWTILKEFCAILLTWGTVHHTKVYVLRVLLTVFRRGSAVETIFFTITRY